VTDLLVIGAGPYGLSVAREAMRAGLSTTVVGRPMSFWREHMPAGMYLRSGPDWHLDPAGALTLREFASEFPDPLPISTFLDYADWFTAEAGIEVGEEEVTRVDTAGAGAASRGFVATLASGATISARNVVAAPGISRFGVIPEWGAGLGEHTCELVDFAAMDGARVLIVGGRQSAYEWAALIGEAGAATVDVVHRHAQPRFDRVSWRFVDQHLEDTLAHPGWWRRLPDSEQAKIARRFWEVGRLTLEYWLEPRIQDVRVHAGAEVAEATAGTVTLTDGTVLPFDRLVFATGYKADLARVPYLPRLATQRLDEHMQSALEGLYLPGFAATPDFGPFFGFVKGAPAAAQLVVADLAARAA